MSAARSPSLDILRPESIPQFDLTQLISRRLPVPRVRPQYRRPSWSLLSKRDYRWPLHQEIARRPLLVRPEMAQLLSAPSHNVSCPVVLTPTISTACGCVPCLLRRYLPTLNLCAFPPDQFREDCESEMYRRK